MNRKLIVEAIIKAHQNTGFSHQHLILEEALKHIVSDASLVCFAQSIGIDTDAILTQAVQS